MLATFCKLMGEHATGKPLLAKQDGIAKPTWPKLARRESEVLELLGQGKSEKEVANALKISTHTVHVHVKSIYRKLGVTSRGELLARYLGSK